MTKSIPSLQSNLLHSAFAIMACAVLTDISNIRSFPSYNMCVGLVAAYCGSYSAKTAAKTKSQTSTFILLATLSLLFDVIFCGLWGGQIFAGYSSSVKFSLIMFIITMFVKALGIYFGASIVTHDSLGSSNTTNVSSCVGGVPYDPADGGIGSERAVEMTSPGSISLQIDDDDNDDDENIRSPLTKQPTIATPIPANRRPPPPPPGGR